MAKTKEKAQEWGASIPMPDTVKDLQKNIYDHILCGIRTIIWGAPGVGKTAMLSQLAKHISTQCEIPNNKVWVVIGSMCDPTDIGGFPVVSGEQLLNGKTVPTLKFAPREFARFLCEEGGTLFLDELTSVPPATRAPLLRVLNEGVIGDIELDPHRTAIVAAANPPGCAVNGYDFEPPVANRLAHLRYPISGTAIREWTQEFPRYWGTEPVPIRFGNRSVPGNFYIQARSYIASFITSNTHLWLDLPKDALDSGLAWPSPRQWTAVSRVIALALSRGDRLETYLSSVRSLVGESSSMALSQFLRQVDFPDPLNLLKNPKAYTINDRPDLNWAILNSVLATLEANLTEDHCINASIILKTASAKIESSQSNAMRFAEMVIDAYQNKKIKTTSDRTFMTIFDNINAYTEVRQKLRKVIESESSRVPQKHKKVTT